MDSNVLKIGLIGLGRMGQNHLRVLSMLRGVELEFIYDSNTDLACRLAAEYGVVAINEVACFLDKVDAVIICTPTQTHAEYIELASPKVKNIFVEKPLAHTLDEAERIARVVTEYSVNVQVGFIERFNPAVRGLKNVLDKSVGVVSVDFIRTNKLSARITDVDVVADLMIHDIDLALYINGPALAVSAHGYAHNQMIDFASALVAHENGRFSRLQASRITEKKMRSIQATCLDMFVDCDLMRKEIVINKQSELSQIEGQPYVISALQENIEVPPQEALLSELSAFIAQCRQDTPMDVPSLSAGLSAMRICDQIQKAIIK